MTEVNFQRFPNFLIVGANKAGTTSIHQYCSQHPQICMSQLKEPMFFLADPKNYHKEKDNKEKDDKKYSPLSNPKFVTSIEEYQELFTHKNRSLCRGESSTAYLATPDVAIPRIKAIYPQMKIIACLRHPIDRALSGHHMYFSEGIETRTFKQCVEDEVEGNLQGIRGGRMYLKLGLYYESVQKYLQAFKKSQVLILFYDQFVQAPEIFMEKIFKFIQVDKTFTPNVKKQFNSSKEREKKYKIDRPKIEQIDPETYQICIEFFKEDVRRLGEIIDFQSVVWNDLQ
jgi:hypothetical protein